MCVELIGAKLCAGCVSSIATLPIDPDHPDPSPHPSPNLDPNPYRNPNPNLNPSPNPLGGSTSVGAVMRLRRVFRWCLKNIYTGGRKAASTNKARILHKVLRRPSHKTSQCIPLPSNA